MINKSDAILLLKSFSYNIDNKKKFLYHNNVNSNIILINLKYYTKY